MKCPCCETEMIWQSDVDTEDVDGTELIESFYDCPECKAFITITINA